MHQLSLFKSVPRRTTRATRHRKGSVDRAAAHTGNLWNDKPAPATEVALLFLDIRDFTRLAEHFDAPKLINLVRKLFSSFQIIIRAHRGRIIETSGDGLYAAFGLETNVADGVNEAVASARSILRSLKAMNHSLFTDCCEHRIEVGIGIHAGEVATGTVRVSSQERLVVMGYAVNIASRIQGVTKELNNNLIVSSTVFTKLADPCFPAKAIDISLRGVSAPMKLHLLGERYREDVVEEHQRLTTANAL